MRSPFGRIDVTAWPVVRTETMGQSPTVWLRDPVEARGSENQWLFKPVETHSNGTVQGGDWAERIVSELANFLEIPSAEIKLALRNGTPGSLSRNIVPHHWDMWTGGLWLDSLPEVSYFSVEATKSKRKRGASAGYSLSNISKALDSVGPPPGHSFTASMSGFEVFGGYLLLDAIVANRDRHEENWGVVVATTGPFEPALSKAFDNAGSLGYQLTDESRRAMLDADGGVARWAARGTAWRFASDAGEKPASLVELARQAAEYVGKPSESQWLAKLDSLTPSIIDAILGRLSGMSEASRMFAKEVILTNVERIRHGYRNTAA